MRSHLGRARRVLGSRLGGRLAVGLLAAVLGTVVLAGLVGQSSPQPTAGDTLAEAANTSQFRAGNIISDQLFYDGAAMSASDVQTFLNQKNPNCVAASDGTPCLKNARQDTYSRAADSRCPGTYVGAANEAASTIIAKVGAACGISQRVLLVILQKEQGLVTASGNKLTSTRYEKAMGFGCPDTAPCNPAYAHLFNQLYSAARQYRDYMVAPRTIKAGIVNNVRFHPDAGCGTSPVFVENYATAGLYTYTPYQPNAAALAAGSGTGDGCSAYGNRNFWIYYTDWFGSTQVPGAANVTGRYAELGGSSGVLGGISDSVVCGLAGGGCYQRYAKGAIYWSAATGARYVLFNGVRDKWGATGWEAGPLGYPTGDAVCGLSGGGCFQTFEHASVYWSSATGAHTVAGAVRDKWGSLGWEGGSLGYPIADQWTTPDGQAQYLHFQRGSVYWSAATGAHVLSGSVYDRWARAGYENSSVGLPVSDVAGLPDGRGSYAHFQNGSIYSSAPGNGFLVLGAVRDKWGTLGWEGGSLGYPVGDQGTTPDGQAQYVHFQRGSIYWSSTTGAHALSGAVYDKWAQTGWEAGPVGLPVTDVASTPDGAATFAHFQDGSVYAHNALGTTVLSTAVRAGWAATGWERGPLGYPTEDAVDTADGGGTAQTFQGGTVFASTRTGGHGVPAVVLAAYERAGGPAGPLGFPTGELLTTTDGTARHQAFEGGSVYVAPSGTFVLPTVFRDAWGAAGYESGPLGYPTSDVVALTGAVGQLVRFQHGTVYWSLETGAHGVPDTLLAAYSDAGGPTGELGMPVSDAGTTPDGRARFQHFEGGSIYALSGGTYVVPAALRDAWRATGWEKGPLGYPTSQATATADGRGRTMTFQGGVVYAGPAGAYAVPTSLVAVYQTAGGPAGFLGLPAGGSGTTPDGKGTYQHFEGGSLYLTAATGARALPTAVRDAWAATGWERGPLGYPTTDVSKTPDGVGSYVHFQGGSVYSTPSTGARALWGAVRDAWAASGWERGPLGYPTSTLATTADGRAQVVAFQGGTVYTSTATGTRTVSGTVLTAYQAAGGAAGALGLPVAAKGTTPDGAATFQHFEQGSIYVTANGARVVPLAIRDVWAAKNWERGPLGYPTSAAVVGSGGQGLVQTFQGGAIVATPSSGVRVLRGAVLATWTAAGGSAGVLGWPTGDATNAPDGVGSYGYFQGGAVYASDAGGAHVLRGAVLDAWARTGWEWGSLGYPTADTVADGDGTRTDFQRGWISVSGATGVATVHKG